MNKYNITIRILKEMQLNYRNQYPKEVPDMDLIAIIIIKEIDEKWGKDGRK